MKLIFLGPPGSGKGTQAKMAAQEFKMAHISMGDILRQAIKDGTDVGKKASDFLKNGLLVPDELVNEIARNAIMKAGKDLVLDGYPRTAAQAAFIEGFTGIDKVIYIDAPQDEIVKRLTGRRSCSNCGAVYNIDKNPPKKEGVCDKCGKELYIRNDDKEGTIKKRFEVYEKETAPLVGYYGGKVVKINGVGELDAVFGRIKAAV